MVYYAAASFEWYFSKVGVMDKVFFDGRTFRNVQREI